MYYSHREAQVTGTMLHTKYLETITLTNYTQRSTGNWHHASYKVFRNVTLTNYKVKVKVIRFIKNGNLHRT